jgi:hypothetical protein
LEEQASWSFEVLADTGAIGSAPIKKKEKKNKEENCQ